MREKLIFVHNLRPYTDCTIKVLRDFYQTGTKPKCLREQKINWGEITVNLLKEVEAKQMVSTSGGGVK